MTKINGLQPKDFVHLHNHTQYSLLDGLTKVPDLMAHIQALGMDAVAITDHGTLSGLIEFYKEAKSHNIKPILGMEAYIAPRKFTNKDASKDKTYKHLILLAINNKGYQNLMRLSTIANLEGYYYKPRIDRDLLKKYNSGIIILSGCIGGEIGDALRQNQYEKAKEIASWYKGVFEDRYYLEIQDHGHSDHPSTWHEQVTVTKATLKLSKELNIPAVLTCDAHYLRHIDKEAHEILLCVQTGSFLTDQKRLTLKEFELHVTNPTDIILRWGSSHPELITNTRVIADRCNTEIELGKILIPKFPVPKKETEKSYLDLLVFQGLVWRYSDNKNVDCSSITKAKAIKILSKQVLERALYELKIIDKMGFNGYFLIIADFINWGKKEGIVFGPGRGSAAGSIISYALNITELDPLKYNLLFERFLNPDRISMPDVDIDIQDNRRDEVILYCIKKYGENRVANIVTFGRMAARNAVRDVSRVMQIPYAVADRWAKMIPQPVQGRHVSLEKSLQEQGDLRQEYIDNEDAKKVFDLAIQLEGTIRNHGVHAAGVVIAPSDIVKFVPLERAQKGVTATQYSMGPIEDLGLLKMDFLGLSNLTIIKNALRIAKKVYSQDINISDIALDDSLTFDLLKKGATTGVFQLESAGMKRYLKQLKPTVFDDIVAMVALYRPGPMQWIDDFIARKNGTKKIEYLHPSMETALESTYGVIVYQEQVMQISKELAGFSGGQADTLRKGIGKKIPEVLAKLKNEFIEGAIKKSKADRVQMEALWKNLEDFAAYCFNKSHAACYAMISYQTAYLKAHFPDAFMAALMSSDFDNTDRLAIEITECKKMGITVLPPDINESYLEFSVVPGKKNIRFGLAAIKNIGAGAADEILNAREKGPFKNLEDFFCRVSSRLVNKKTLDSLIKAGAIDSFYDRSTLLHNLELLLAFSSRVQKQNVSGQTDLFGVDSQNSHKSAPMLLLEKPNKSISNRDMLLWERELLGIYLSHHPLDDFVGILSEQTIPLSSLKAIHDNKTVSIGGGITDIREIMTKNGQKMAFVKVADQFGEIELVLFPGVYQQTTGIWKRDNVVLVKGKINAKDRNGEIAHDLKILVDDARELTHEQAMAYQKTGKKPKKLKDNKLKIDNVEIPKIGLVVNKRFFLRIIKSDDSATLLELKKLIDTNVGTTEVVLVLGNEVDKQIVRLPARVTADKATVYLLQSLIGKKNVKLQ